MDNILFNINMSKVSIPMPEINAYDSGVKWNPIENHIPRSVLILGNGFDLDLGIQTKYSQFADSPDWPFKDVKSYEDDTLPYFLNSHKNQVDTWFDLEELLANYACKSTGLTKDKILKAKQDFYVLSNALNEYLVKQEDDFVKQMNDSIGRTKRATPAHYILQHFLKKEVRTIYTFNYTNAYRISKQFILNIDAVYNHIHGSTRESNIILGAGDQRNLKDDFFEFYKSANPFYKSNNLVEDLNDADEVYIFGHSLGKNDHDYFSDFFKKVCKSVHRPFAPGKIKVRIFTYDEKSEIDIKKQLMTLTDNHLIGIYAHCDFKILKTSKKYQSDWLFKDDMV